MIHLRYLYLSSDSCSPRTITEYLSELWNLQFLKIVRSSTGRDDDDEKGRLKLRKVNQLRHIMCYGFSLSLLIEKEVINSDDNNGGGGGGLLKNLQTLIGLDAEFCVEDVLSMTPNLVTLHLISKGTIISQNQLVILPLLLKRLQKLELSCKIVANPEICHQNITHLVLRNTQINGGYLMRALRKLHKNLRVLELLIRSVSFTKEGEAGVLDFSSSDGDDDDDGFGQLTFLKLEDLKGLKEWKMSVGVMPSLQKELELDSYHEQLRTDAKRLAEEHLPKDQLKLLIVVMDLVDLLSETFSKWPTTSQHNKPTSLS
ncbi:uncharacterized protein LOC122072946 isoform X2 [Macadamia integrifolia]|uniref:uncharacterized protein LOC122072946 isoform X2 n=1 Tax=Macadamia integrifolia TaxID=60698 RepID=UPI001C4EC234|nr:uncharacterized protein LOC122072946 isoform X2 [Macadamia integrifolia]